MIGDVALDEKGEIINTLSEFQPESDVVELTKNAKKDFNTGTMVMERSYREFNNRNVYQEIDYGQLRFNSYVEERLGDPDESWRHDGVRPITRNKLLSIAAHSTAVLLFPNAFAQNEEDEEDQDAAEIMRSVIKWNIVNSDYASSVLYAVIAALANPVSYLELSTDEAKQKRRSMINGDISVTSVIDDVLSGMQHNNIPAEEVLIATAYQRHIQKQRFLWRVKRVSYDDAYGLFGDHKNFGFVKPGIRVFLQEDSGMFYEQADDELPDTVQIAYYKNRREDMEVPYVGGIYMGHENVEANMMRHRDNNDLAKYNLVKFGYSPIDEGRFYFYKSAANSIGPDQDAVDVAWRLAIDGSLLDGMPPLAVMGDEIIDSSMVGPGLVTNLEKETKVENLLPNRNTGALWNAVHETERSITEGTQDDVRAGITGSGSRTAFEIDRIERNARINLGPFGKFIGEAIRDYGYLIVDDILNHQTVGQFEEVLAGNPRLKFRTFLLAPEVENGRMMSKKIIFTDELIGIPLSDEEVTMRGLKMLNKVGGLKGTEKIYLVNPHKFRRLRFLLTIDVDNLLPENEAFMKAIKLEAYDRMIENPFVDQEAVTRDFLVNVFAKGETDKYMKRSMDGVPAEEIIRNRKTRTSPIVAQATGSSALTGLL